MSETIKHLNNSDTVIVENLSDNQCGYVLATNGQVRRFMPHIQMEIPVQELRELYYQHGGPYLIQNYLRIHNRNLAAEFGISDDEYSHEYSWTAQDVDKCLKEDDINVLLDALDFAPQGIVDSLKQRAVELEIPDTRKLKAIGEKTNSDLEAMIRNKHAYDTAADTVKEQPKQRRVSNTPQRRRRV